MNRQRISAARCAILATSLLGFALLAAAGSAQAAESPKAEAPNPGLLGTALLEGWARNFSLGFAGSQGKSEDVTVNARLKVDKEDDRARRNFNSKYYYSSNSGDSTSNEFLAEYGHDFLFRESRWFLFGRGRYDFDEFEAWDHRIGGSAGSGYQFVKTPRWELLGRLAAGVIHTWKGINETRPEGQAGLDFKWTLSDSDTLTLTNSYFHDFKNTSDLRFVTSLAWKVALDYLEGLGFTLGVDNEYDTRRVTDKNNLKYFANIGYDF